ALMFASMLIAVPLCAVRVMQHTASAMAVRTSSVDLVKDLIRAKELSRDLMKPVTLTSKPAAKDQPFRYVIEKEGKTLSEVDLPSGVSLIGSVTFDKQGLPETRASFVLSNGPNTISVEVDPKGLVTVPK